MLNYYNVSFHFFGNDAQMYFKTDSKHQCFSKLNTVLNYVQTLIFKRKLKMNKDKTNIMRNIDLLSKLKLDETDINL